MSSNRARPTIDQVATLAGVSVTTVSNALNGRTASMTPATFQRVMEAARTLGYHPSQVARSLVTRRTATVGLVIAEIGTTLFFGAVSAAERLARQMGYNLLLCHASNRGEEEQALGLLQEKEVDGVIFISTSDYGDDSHLSRFASAVPLVTINRAGPEGIFDRVSWDNVGGVASAVRHLFQLGHRRIGHLRGPSDRQSTDERFRGYLSGLEECNLEYRPEYVAVGDYTAPSHLWEAAAEQLLGLPDRPTAIISSDDSVAAVVIRAAAARGLTVPDKLAVVGIDDQPFADFLTPPLTTLRLPLIEAGQEAMMLLLKRLEGEPAEPRHVVLPTALVIRRSCGERPHSGQFDEVADASPS
jgi:LacI family transcriptional regulator